VTGLGDFFTLGDFLLWAIFSFGRFFSLGDFFFGRFFTFGQLV
jgi:hypothetical protein